jgi:hypothetical protein
MHRSSDECCWTSNGRQRKALKVVSRLSGNALALVLVKKAPRKHLRTSDDHRGD